MTPDIAYLNKLRASGVSRLSVTDEANDTVWAVDFFAPVTADVAQSVATTLDEGLCKCSHSESEHNEAGECLRGCSGELCTNEAPK